MFPNHSEWERTENFGALPQHCYFIPFDKADKLSEEREASSRFISLNGLWAFREHTRIEDCELTEDLFDQIPVPSCVQMEGFDELQYTNARYPFPFDPPYISKNIPAFHYRRSFKTEKGKMPRLVFEGVDSAFYVFVNGKFLGYSQISHKTTEYALDGFLLPDRENTLDVIVLKWCASSYLEDQDKWRFSGIFRDVYLLYRDQDCVEDYFITAYPTGTGATVCFSYLRGGKCSVTFEGETKTVCEGEKAIFTLNNARLWSAETPNLYDLTIACGNEMIKERVGIRSIKTKNGVLLFNEQPIKFLGVNRHESHPERGATVTIADMRKDLELMKSFHVNAIRTSHYPDSPEFYRLCDEYGFYVIDEADVESHGVVATDGGYAGERYNDLANADLYESAIMERVLTLFERDKNRPCVTLWSLGNESGYGKNFVRAAYALKARDNTRLVHYEQLANIEGLDEYYDDTLDVASRMYPSLAWMKNFLEDKRETRPLVLCEYAHAMGNGPGDLPDYWRLIRSSERFAGGFVWEWADHGIGKVGHYRYGGDFGEILHDGNFCIDGILSPDRKFKSGTLEMSAVYQPAEFTYADGVLTVFNRYYFKPLVGKLKLEVKQNGKLFSRMTDRVAISPRSKMQFKITSPEAEGGFAGLVCTLQESDGYLSHGFAQLLSSKPRPVLEQAKSVCEEVGGNLVYRWGAFTATVERGSGDLMSFTKDGKEVLAEPLTLSAQRAPTDNERNLVAYYEQIGLYLAKPWVHVKEKEGEYRAQGKLFFDCRRSILDYELVYRPTEMGLRVLLTCHIPDYVKTLPCVGFRCATKEVRTVEYLGYGGRETYCDMRACEKDVFAESANRQYHNYIKPQESGNHTGSEYFKTEALEVFGEEPFDFSVIPFSVSELRKKRHAYQLKRTKNSYYFFGVQSGIGSNSCGPELAEVYRTPKTGTFCFDLLPL